MQLIDDFLPNDMCEVISEYLDDIDESSIVINIVDSNDRDECMELQDDAINKIHDYADEATEYEALENDDKEILLFHKT